MFWLDEIDPHHAIAAMQGINREARNMVFAPAFFGTPVASRVTATALYFVRARRSALTPAMATVSFNSPMNEVLSIVAASGIYLATSANRFNSKQRAAKAEA